MTAFDDAVSEWGRLLGMAKLRFGNEDVIELQMESSGSLYLEKSGDDLLLYVVQPIAYPTTALFRRSLELCDPRRHPDLAVNAGLRGNNRLAFFARLSGENVHPANIDQIFRLLCEMHSSVANIS